MKTNKKSKVYILGAGCSVGYGYPLAKNFVEELGNFGKSLSDQAAKIKQIVESTVNLMRQQGIVTIDDLAARIHSGQYDDKEDLEKGSIIVQQSRERRIGDAKIATSIMFLSKEKSAIEKRMANYRDFIHELMPNGRNWQEKLKNSRCHVLTFNYDRLFEIAFSEVAEPDLLRRFGLYSPQVLNSGLNSMTPGVQFESDQFSYLKLHGSVGITAHHDRGELTFYTTGPKTFGAGQIMKNIFDTDSAGILRSYPMMVFPSEKHHVQNGGQHLFYETYIKAVWDRARELIAEASEIHIIGYSFQALDRQPLLNLLAGAKHCEQGIIQNMPA